MYRHENKYTGPAHLLDLIESRVRLLPQAFRRAYPPRYVNSLYYDSPLAGRYWENVEGEAWRSKVRVRWYGDFWGEVPEPELELKLKAGHAGRKERSALASFHLRPTTTGRELRDLLTAVPSGSPRPLGLEAVLATRYQRRYYATPGGRLRLTLDEDVRYLGPPGPRGFPACWRRDPEFVAELKYDVRHRGEAEAAAQALGLRWVRNSKFAKGLRAVR